ncbi:MAG: hypothetical protein ACK5HT_06435 [Draconibacterium sp.]
MVRLFLISILWISFTGNIVRAECPQVVNTQLVPDTLLDGIQSKIYNAFVQSLMSRDSQPIRTLNTGLENLYETNPNNLIQYWRSYLQFYSSIYYLKNGDEKSAEKETDKGIGLLEEMDNKSSEDFALLSMLQGFGIQFKGIKAMFVSAEIKKNAKQAIAMDSTNLRAYYVYANNDFHTPEKYGGGKEAEAYLVKAVSLPAQTIKNEYLPSWGKEESYEMLIKLYIRQERWDLVKKYFQEGIKEFPNSYTINQLAPKLVGK